MSLASHRDAVQSPCRFLPAVLHCCEMHAVGTLSWASRCKDRRNRTFYQVVQLLAAGGSHYLARSPSSMRIYCIVVTRIQLARASAITVNARLSNHQRFSSSSRRRRALRTSRWPTRRRVFTFQAAKGGSWLNERVIPVPSRALSLKGSSRQGCTGWVLYSMFSGLFGVSGGGFRDR